MAVPGKQYGLILSQKGASKAAAIPRPSIFGDDSDEEATVGESLLKEAAKKKMMKQTRLEMHKALEQDSTVYDYDGVYDDMQKQRLETSKKILGGADKKPKYINQLIRAVEERKKEQERRDERKIQKEREAEGEKFADKEAYVTSAYRQKLQERKEEEEKEKRLALMEAALDVKKQKDLSGFYRHLLNQTVGEEAIPDGSSPKPPTPQAVKIKEEPSEAPPSPPSGDHGAGSHSDSEEGPVQKAGFTKPAQGAAAHSKRHYRQRSPSSGSGEEREKERERKSHRDRERERGKDRERDREDDRHGRRREDKDRARDRERDRDEDRGRGGRREKEREERHGRRDRSPRDRERERERNAEKDKKRDLIEDKEKRERKEGESEEKRERKEGESEDKEKRERRERKETESEDKGEKRERKEGESENKGEKSERKEGEKETEQPEGTEAVGEDEKEKAEGDAGEEGGKEGEEPKVNKFAKRSSDQTVGSARERYLARQVARSTSKTYIEKEED